MAIPNEFLQIDEEGYALTKEVRIQDLEVGNEILRNMRLHEGGTLLSTFGGEPVIIEAFDEPYVAAQVYFSNNYWRIQLPYEVTFTFDLHSLSVDEWDRFHGYAENGIPFVMSRKAQALFFEAITEFDDDSITWKGEHIPVPAYWQENSKVNHSSHWTRIYHEEKNPGWNLGEPAEGLKDMLPRIKLARSRILVPGCGEGHDAAFFAERGHIVYAVDFSEEAIARAKAKYGHIEDLHFVQADIFKLPTEWIRTFDVVFEHTCYCAVSPERRQELINVYKKMLHETGHLMGVFFTFEKRASTPYGGSEWELRQRIKDSFNFIFWGRLRNSVPRRMGKELFIYAAKKPQ